MIDNGTLIDRSHTSCYCRTTVTLGPTLYRFRIKARYWSKIAIFHTPSAFDPIDKVDSVGISPKHFVWENENGGATRGRKQFEDMFTHFDQHTNVTEGRRQEQTNGRFLSVVKYLQLYNFMLY